MGIKKNKKTLKFFKNLTFFCFCSVFSSKTGVQLNYFTKILKYASILFFCSQHAEKNNTNLFKKKLFFCIFKTGRNNLCYLHNNRLSFFL